MKKTAYWHVYLTEDIGTWSGIVMEQLACMEKVSLLKRLDRFKATVINHSVKHLNIFTELAQLMYPGIEIEGITNPCENDRVMLYDIAKIDHNKSISENHTIRKIYKDCLDEDQAVLYFHTKGITVTAKYLEGLANPWDRNVERWRNYYYWRQFLNWGALEEWATCVSLLEDGSDIAGPNFQREPVPHYSGAFWWSKSSHIRQLPDPSTTAWWEALQASTTDPWLKTCSPRFRDELWIGQADYNYSAIDIGNGHPNPASTYHPQSEYWK